MFLSREYIARSASPSHSVDFPVGGLCCGPRPSHATPSGRAWGCLASRPHLRVPPCTQAFACCAQGARPHQPAGARGRTASPSWRNASLRLLRPPRPASAKQPHAETCSATAAGTAAPPAPRDSDCGDWPHGWQVRPSHSSHLFSRARVSARLDGASFRSPSGPQGEPANGAKM